MQKDESSESGFWANEDKAASCTSLSDHSVWQAVPAPAGSVDPIWQSVVRTEWKYDNQGSGQTAILVTLMGKVCYIHGDTVTDYHGSFREDAYNGWVVIKFDCRGDESNLKSMQLLKQPDGSYSGPDYKLRNVVLVVLTKMSESRSYRMHHVGVCWRLEWQNMTVNCTGYCTCRWCTWPDELPDPGEHNNVNA